LATRGRFQLIEIMIPARKLLSSTLQRFVAGVKRLSSPRPGLRKVRREALGLKIPLG
jgi:hypothetical protein